MGRFYYYFAASLVHITFESNLPMSVDDFLDMAGRLMSKGDCDVLKGILSKEIEEIQTASVTVKNWIEFNRAFYNEITWFRAGRLHQDPAEHMRGPRPNDPRMIDVINEASRKSNLLDAQKCLDRFRWQVLDEMTAQHFFDFEYIIAYGIKLQMLEKYAPVFLSEGKDVFDDIKGEELTIA